MKIRLIVGLCLISILVLLFIPLSGSASEPFTRSLESASELDYPPFSLVKPDGSADGFSVERMFQNGILPGQTWMK